MTTITLYRTPAHQWIAIYSGDGARAIQRLFGTSHIPTPFGPCDGATWVRAEVASRNPEAIVTVAPGEPERVPHD